MLAINFWRVKSQILPNNLQSIRKHKETKNIFHSSNQALGSGPKAVFFGTCSQESKRFESLHTTEIKKMRHDARKLGGFT
jgi:hypothetical protein